MKRLLILDYGSQFTQLIARTIREIGVFCEIHPHNANDTFIRDFAADGFILSGGPQSVTATDAPRINNAVLTAGKPILGICYGMQILAEQLGGTVAAKDTHEYGSAKAHITDNNCPLWHDMDSAKVPVWMSHADHVVHLPPGFMATATSDDGIIAAMRHPKKHYYGLQFHPEVAHTPNGKKLLENFLFHICKFTPSWTMPNFIARATDDIRGVVGNDGVLLGLSGGVDSAVVAALLQRTIGDKLTCVLVDNGLLRDGEVQTVSDIFTRQFRTSLRVIDARAAFFNALVGITDPEEKRRRIGHMFIEFFEQEAKALGSHVRWLAQGTIYPDVVESAKTGTGKATIKTHHNVGGLPERLNLKLLEPLRELFKDEVRRLGTTLGLDEKFVWRHPFPGPGLAVRVLGEVTEERVATVRQADTIFLQELMQAGAYHQTTQAFAVLLPVCSVGVMGDSRTYENVIALRAVTTDDFMTADWTRLDGDILARTAGRIINEVRGVNRVVYDISSKPPATVEWE